MEKPGQAERSEHENRVALADVITTRRDEIVRRWIARVQAELNPDLDIIQLRDAMPDYLDRLADALRAGEPSLPRSGTAIWTDVAREHALTRVRHGFNVDQLVHEFIVLRTVVSEMTRERQLDNDLGQASRIADLIEAAVAVAVRSYVEARDYAARQKEAEHISFITHELRNPLSSVRLAAERLRSVVPSGHARTFDILERNVHRLATLIDSVMGMERFEAGKVKAKPVNATLGDLLAQPVATARLAAEAKGLTLTADYDPELLVRADPALATSAITNVLDNAVKYSDEGAVRLAAEPGTENVTLHVWDNCSGLSEAELRTIFEPFERGASKKPGSGLGLAIARRALQAQHGAIGVNSNEERGCHFWIALPRVLQ